jgi:hypothetical protein
MSDTSQNINYICSDVFTKRFNLGIPQLCIKMSGFLLRLACFQARIRRTSFRGSHPHGTFLSPIGGTALRADCDVILTKLMLRRTPTRGSHPHGRKNTALKGGAFFTSQKGFEPLTDGLEGRCSIQLSYWDIYV